MRAAPRLLTLLGVLFVLASSSAVAQRADAEALFARGVAAAREGEWDRARELFTQADALLPHPNIRINLAAALVQTGRLREAAALYARILEEHRGALGDRTDEVRGALAQIEARLPTLELELDGALPGDLLEIDAEGVELADGRARIRVDPGSHAVEVRRGSETIARRSVELAEGARLSLTLTLESTPDRPTSNPSPGPAPAAATEPNWPAIALLGGGALVLASSLYPLIRMQELQGSEELTAFRDLYSEDVEVCGPMVARPARLAEICSEAADLFIAEWVLVAIGGAAVITGGVLMLVLGPELEVGPSARVRPIVGPGLAAMTLEVTVSP
ncbi:MAG: tetratricopeptide repeat protein [Sandaracinaceae bacterium]|nr:tetratricopeptide repeat protein [Sandaracinaceae bacterium]